MMQYLRFFIVLLKQRTEDTKKRKEAKIYLDKTTDQK